MKCENKKMQYSYFLFWIVICSTTSAMFSDTTLFTLPSCSKQRIKHKLASKLSVLLFNWDTASWWSWPSASFFWEPVCFRRKWRQCHSCCDCANRRQKSRHSYCTTNVQSKSKSKTKHELLNVNILLCHRWCLISSVPLIVQKCSTRDQR